MTRFAAARCRKAALSHALAAAAVLTVLPGSPVQARQAPEAAAPTANDPASALRLARAMRAAGDARSSVELYRAAAERKGADPALRIELGEALLDARLVDEAIGVFTAAASDSRIAAEAELGLARAALTLDQPADALVHAERAAKLAPRDQRVLIGYGVALDRAGRHEEAQAAYRSALAVSPRNPIARNNLALSLAFSGRFAEAVALVEPIARSADATPRDRQNLAFIYGLKGDRDMALALSRIDLDEATAQANLAFYDFARAAQK